MSFCQLFTDSRIYATTFPLNNPKKCHVGIIRAQIRVSQANYRPISFFTKPLNNKTDIQIDAISLLQSKYKYATNLIKLLILHKIQHLNQTF